MAKVHHSIIPITPWTGCQIMVIWQPFSSDITLRLGSSNAGIMLSCCSPCWLGLGLGQTTYNNSSANVSIRPLHSQHHWLITVCSSAFYFKSNSKERKQLNANDCCCLTSISNMLLYLSPSRFSLSIVFSVAYQSEKWFNYNNLSDLLKFKDLQHSSMTSKFPTRSVMPEENGCHVNEVYRMASPKLK